MRSGAALLVAATALFALTLTVRAKSLPLQLPQSWIAALATTVSSTPPAAGRLAAASSEPAAELGYVGSEACARCHQDDYDQWKQSLHVRMTKPVEDAEVLGDFSGVRLSAHGRAFEFGRDAGRPLMRISFGGRSPQTFAVDYTLGFKRYQGYLSRLPDGAIYVLPAFWHVETRRWIDWKEITPVPDGAHELRQIWNSNCFNCHATNLRRGFDLDARTLNTTWTEMGIGCEACHGPGRRHVELIDAALKDPSLKPGGTLEIYSTPSGTARQAFDTCGYCHGNKKNVFVSFTAGSRYEDFALPFLISTPIPQHDAQGEFWPDGRPNRFNRTQALTMSGCFKAGEIACTTCHSAHGSPNPFSLRVDITKGSDGDKLCTQCHTEFEQSDASPAFLRTSQPSATMTARQLQGVTASLKENNRTPVERHTFHAANSEGSRCISCHMSDVNWRLLIRRRDHTFQAPVPELTSGFGVPNACTTCHDDRSPEWAAKRMDEWWGNAARRQAVLAVATTMYRAGSGDSSVIPELARLAVDRSQGLIIRASAVEFMEQFAAGTAGSTAATSPSQTSFVGPQAPGARARPSQTGSTLPPPVKLSAAQVNALIGAAADPEPTVRAQAVTALLATGERERILAPLTARLMDPARVVRVRAAEGLLALGITDLPGAAGALLIRAQDEYALSLSDFPDVPDNYAALGWLRVQRGETREALQALENAIQLNPAAPRPYVIKGVIAAREGRFHDAAELWKKAKSVDATYPNIDRLIDEAEKRKQP